MALIDVSQMLFDPDFTDTVQIVRRETTINEWGEAVMHETMEHVTVVVQGNNSSTLKRVPQGVSLADLITVYYAGKLYAQRPDGYSDVILWRDNRYQVIDVPEDFTNFGTGFCQALCQLEKTHV